MKRQYRIASIVSTMLMVVSFLSQPLLGQQSTSQSPAQQPPETAQQPQQSNQTAPAQPSTAPANTTAPANAQLPSTNNPGQQAQPQQQPSTSGTTVNPSQGPLQPVTTYPNANDQQQADEPIAAPAQATTTTVPEAPQPKKPAEPVGAAAAESVPTAGGAAAKPAGVAIAPAKQHQTRSLLIKVGAALAAGAAIGTVFALSKGTSSTPPGTGTPGVTPR